MFSLPCLPCFDACVTLYWKHDVAGVAMKLLRHIICVLAVLMGSAVAAHSELSVERLSTDSGIPYLLLHGEFAASDQFGGFLSAVGAHHPVFVVFDSPGGNPYAAMKLGRLIRSFQLNTLQIKQLECSSACALAFLGGVQRMALPGSIGVHRTSFVTTAPYSRDEAVAWIQESTADLLAYLEEMGVDAGLLQFALRYDQNDMRYLSASEMASLRVTTTTESQPSRPAQPNTSYVSPPVPPVTNLPMSATDRAVAFVRSLVAAHSNGRQDARSLVTNTYAGNVSYFGKSLSISEIIADKQRYFERWPERSYRIRDESLSVRCQTPALCTVAGIYDWAVRSAPRNRQASGTARFSFMIKVDGNPLVLSENSEVINRR